MNFEQEIKEHQMLFDRLMVLLIFAIIATSVLWIKRQDWVPLDSLSQLIAFILIAMTSVIVASVIYDIKFLVWDLRKSIEELVNERKTIAGKFTILYSCVLAMPLITYHEEIFITHQWTNHNIFAETIEFAFYELMLSSLLTLFTYMGATIYIEVKKAKPDRSDPIIEQMALLTVTFTADFSEPIHVLNKKLRYIIEQGFSFDVFDTHTVETIVKRTNIMIDHYQNLRPETKTKPLQAEVEEALHFANDKIETIITKYEQRSLQTIQTEATLLKK